MIVERAAGGNAGQRFYVSAFFQVASAVRRGASLFVQAVRVTRNDWSEALREQGRLGTRTKEHIVEQVTLTGKFGR